MTTARRVTYVGHSTVLVDLDGVRLLTDPALRSRIAHLRRVHGVDHHSLRGIDAVLISHLHYDHLDLPSLQRLGRELPLIVPRGAGGLLRRRGFRSLTELAEGESLRIGGLGVRATHAEHDAGRGPLGARAQPLGFVIEGSRSIYFPGDTDLFPAMDGIADPLDLALLPVWGWGPSVGAGHLDPNRAAEALALLRPRLCVPIHWGTYGVLQLRGGATIAADPPHEFARRARRLAPDVDVRVLQPGEALDLP